MCAVSLQIVVELDWLSVKKCRSTLLISGPFCSLFFLFLFLFLKTSLITLMWHNYYKVKVIYFLRLLNQCILNVPYSVIRFLGKTKESKGINICLTHLACIVRNYWTRLNKIFLIFLSLFLSVIVCRMEV